MLIKRELYLERLIKFKDTEFVKVITGVRRSGKTFIMDMFRQHLQESGISEERIVFMNFESLKFRDQRDSLSLYQYVMTQRTEEKMYLFFDEVQLVTGWEEAINSFRVDLDCDIYVSGSNASLLSGELATLLSGRMVEIQIFPLSFKEYLDFTDYEGLPDLVFNDYVRDGGFPATVFVDEPEVKQSILDGIYNSILLRDVSERGRLRNDGQLLSIADFLMSEIGNTISANKIAGTLKNEGFKSANANSVSKYIALLEDAFIFYRSQRYDIRGREYLRTTSKFFAVDTGLRNASLGKNHQDNFGHQIENIVYIELLRRGYRVDVGKYDDLEVDFVAKKGSAIEYFQVTMQLPYDNDREIGNLRNIPDNYRKTVITANRMDVGNDYGIEIKHIVDWLLE